MNASSSSTSTPVNGPSENFLSQTSDKTTHTLAADTVTTKTDVVVSISLGLVAITDIEGSTSSGSVTIPGNGLYLHPHWQKFIEAIESTPDALRFGIGVFITMICIVGVVGNCTAIYIFLRTPSLRTPSNLLVINLAASDMAFSLICGFPLMSVASFEKRWIWGDSACSWYGFVAGLCGLNSINSLVTISVDRYLAIARPLTYMYQATKVRAFQMMSLTWLWALVWSLPPMLGWSKYITEGLQISCTFDYLTRTTANIAYNYCLVGFEFVLPVTIIVVCYMGIIRSVRKNSKEMMRLDVVGDGQSGVDQKRRQQGKQAFKNEVKLAKIAAFMISLFILSWLPYAIVAQLGIAGLQDYVTPYVAQFPVMLAKSSAIWNPIVYSLTHPRYKMALANRLPGPLRRACCQRLLMQPTTNKTAAMELSSSSQKRTVFADNGPQQTVDSV